MNQQNTHLLKLALSAWFEANEINQPKIGKPNSSVSPAIFSVDLLIYKISLKVAFQVAAEA